jgi:MoaA/NifB/PqqE/SkfB family radical SAM enzyme
MLTGLHFVLSYRCTHQCDHCFVHSGPGSRGTFTLDQIRRTLAEVVRIGTVERVYYEGGEPFLYYPLLLEGLRAARKSGFEVGVVTNAYWAETEEDAEIWLRPLAEIGMADLSVSDDPLHHGDGSESPARRALRAAERLGIPAGAICTPRPEQGEGVRFRGRAAD